MRRVLLVNPNFGPAAGGVKRPSAWQLAARWSPFKEVMVPLGLATVAALTPEDVAVDIWDDAIDGPIDARTTFRNQYALVGVTGYINHAERVKAIGQVFRQRGILTAVGGPGVSAEPEFFRDHFDVIFIGEAELTWPRFIAEWQAGRPHKEYCQVGKVDMACSPAPNWRSVRVNSYLLGAIQTTRGCPFDCEFCDVPTLYGWQARHKTIERVLAEVGQLERSGLRRIYFCDDNFIGNPRFAKDLVRALIRFNQGLQVPVSFFAQLTLNVAKDDEMLALMAAANFPGFFIGIESPNRDSLIEMNKPQNYKTDIARDVKKIQSHGLIVQSGVVVGFDHDDVTIFDRQFQFLQEAGIAICNINILKAPTGTRLWARLHKSGRVFDVPEGKQTPNIEALTNLVPAQMNPEQLLSGYIALVERVRNWRNFEARVRTMISQVAPRPGFRWRGYGQEIMQLPVLLWSMDGEARRTTLRLLLHCLRRAPFMAESVMGIVAFQYLETLRTPLLRESVQRQLRRLSEPGLSLEPAPGRPLIPDAFQKPYRAMFPELYRRVHLGLADKSRAPEALVVVVRDFLVRCGPDFQQLGEHHRRFMDELCDRAIAAENRKLDLVSTATSARPLAAAAQPDPRHIKWIHGLSEDVLRSVEQDLRSLHPA